MRGMFINPVRMITGSLCVAGLCAAMVVDDGEARAQALPKAKADASARGPEKAVTPADRDQQLRALTAEAATLSKERQSLLNELRTLEIDRQSRGIELTRATEALATLKAQMAVASTRHDQTRRDLDALRPLVRHRLVRLYKLGRLGYSRLLLDAREARTFRETTQVVSVMARRDRALLERYRATLDTLAGQRARLDTQHRDAATLQTTLESARAALDRAIAARTARVKEIQGRQDLNTRLVAEVNEASGRLDASVTTLAAAPSAAAASLPASAATYAWPVGGPNTVTSTFGRERTSRFGTQIARNGIEITAREEEPVVAAKDGTVAFADAFQGFGQLIIVEHGAKTFTLYGHLARMNVVRGDHVRQGQPIGAAGRTPTGESALYFELRIDGRPVDPVRWLKR